MVVLGIVTLSAVATAGATDSSGSTRLLLLVLLLIAVALILAGCCIALLTFRKQRFVSRSAPDSGRIEGKRV